MASEQINIQFKQCGVSETLPVEIRVKVDLGLLVDVVCCYDVAVVAGVWRISEVTSMNLGDEFEVERCLLCLDQSNMTQRK